MSTQHMQENVGEEEREEYKNEQNGNPLLSGNHIK